MHELYGAPPGQVLRSIAKSGGQFVKHLYLMVPQAVINTAVNENANLFSANVLFEVFQNINSDGAGKVFVLAGRIDFGYQLINADAFFFGYGGKFGVEFVFQRNAGLVSAGDDYGFFAHFIFCGKRRWKRRLRRRWRFFSVLLPSRRQNRCQYCVKWVRRRN